MRGGYYFDSLVLQPPLPLQLFLPLQPLSPVLQPPLPLQSFLPLQSCLSLSVSSSLMTFWPASMAAFLRVLSCDGVDDVGSVAARAAVPMSKPLSAAAAIDSFVPFFM